MTNKKYKYKCGFCGVLKEDFKTDCPQVKCQQIQDEANEVATREYGIFLRDEQVDERNGFIQGYYYARINK